MEFHPNTVRYHTGTLPSPLASLSVSLATALRPSAGAAPAPPTAGAAPPSRSRAALPDNLYIDSVHTCSLPEFQWSASPLAPLRQSTALLFPVLRWSASPVALSAAGHPGGWRACTSRCRVQRRRSGWRWTSSLTTPPTSSTFSRPSRPRFTSGS